MSETPTYTYSDEDITIRAHKAGLPMYEIRQMIRAIRSEDRHRRVPDQEIDERIRFQSEARAARAEVAR